MNLNLRIVIASGSFDPLHAGHIHYLNAAKSLGDILIVALRSDQWVVCNNGTYFLPWTDRETILASFNVVDRVIEFNDPKSIISIIKNQYPSTDIIFAYACSRVGYDMSNCEEPNVSFQFNVGSENIDSKSKSILGQYAAYTKNILDLESCPFKGYS